MGVDTYQYYYLGVAIFLVTILTKWTYEIWRSPIAKLPGPWYTNWTDAVLRYKAVAGLKVQYVEDLHRIHGPIVRISPSEASLRSPDVARKVYSVKGEFLKAAFYENFVSDVTSVFSTRDVALHRRFRRLLSSGISESSLLTHLSTIERNVDLAITQMGKEMEKRGATDVFHWFLCMATDIIGELSFGQSFKMLETGEKSQYIRDLELTAKFGGIRATFPLIMKLGQYIRIPLIREAIANRRRTLEYAEQSVARHYRIVEEEGEDAKPTLLSKLYKAGDEGMTFHEVHSNATTYIIGGSDTTGNTLTYLVWTLCKQPELKARLLQELDTLPDNYGYQQVKSLHYLNLVIEEALRLYSAVPDGLPRTVPPEGAKFFGYYIPGGFTVSIGAYNMHRNPAVFSKPASFDPLRWEAPTKDMRDSFVPFGGGSRVCLGLHLARMELRLATTRFFKTFPNARVSSVEGFCDADMEAELFFFISPKAKRCLIEVP